MVTVKNRPFDISKIPSETGVILAFRPAGGKPESSAHGPQPLSIIRWSRIGGQALAATGGRAPNRPQRIPRHRRGRHRVGREANTGPEAVRHIGTRWRVCPVGCIVTVYGAAGRRYRRRDTYAEYRFVAEELPCARRGQPARTLTCPVFPFAAFAESRSRLKSPARSHGDSRARTEAFWQPVDGESVGE